MKKLCQFSLCLCLAAAAVLAASSPAASSVAASSPVASSVAESGLVVLGIAKDSVRLRSAPDTVSDIVAGLDTGAVVVAEQWPALGVKGSGDSAMSWYRIVALAGKESGNVTGALRAFPKAFSYPYVSAELVQPYSGELSTTQIIEGVTTTPYGMGYSAVDVSMDSQRRMAEQRTLKWAFSPAEGVTVPVHAEADAASGVLGHYSEKNWRLVVLDDSRPGWLLMVDLAGEAPSGWVEANRLEAAPRDATSQSREPGYLVTLTLGANIPEIMRRWGPGTVKARQVEKATHVYGAGTEYEEKITVVSDKTLITAEGFELIYGDCNNFTFTLTRPNAGLGGIFVGVDWCDKEYIERVFGNLSPEFSSQGGLDRCTLGGGPDGWQFSIHLEFDSKGLVSKFFYQCGDVVLN